MPGRPATPRVARAARSTRRSPRPPRRAEASGTQPCGGGVGRGLRPARTTAPRARRARRDHRDAAVLRGVLPASRPLLLAPVGVVILSRRPPALHGKYSPSVGRARERWGALPMA